MALDLRVLRSLRSFNMENMEIAVIYMQLSFFWMLSIKDPIIYNTSEENREGIQVFAVMRWNQS